MHAIHAMHAEGKLPHLKQIFIAFLEGVLMTWKRFSAEFAADGEIAKLTDHERFLRWMPTTNDANEGTLGESRGVHFLVDFDFYYWGPLNYADMAYKHNHTQTFIDHIGTPAKGKGERRSLTICSATT